MSLVGYDSSSSDGESENSSQPSGRGLSAIPSKPKGSSSHMYALGGIVSGSSKGGIRITAPEMPALEMDSDDEESLEPAKKKRVEGNIGDKPRSGLFAKLPAPVNAAKTGMQSNTNFIPYIFTNPKKKDNDLKKAEIKAKTVADKQEPIIEKHAIETVPSIAETRKRSLQAASKIISSRGASLAGVGERSETTTVPTIAEIRKRSARASAKLLSSKTAKQAEEKDDSDDEVGFFSYVEKVPEDGIPEMEHPEPEGINKMELAPNVVAVPEAASSQYYSSYNIPYANSAAVAPPVSAVAMENDPLEMLRLQGKRNRNEQINFIDIHQDDALEGGKEMLLKHISEEKGVDRSKVHVPGGMMKKKHQLPYLVQQAKAREVELKNTWAQNRQTKQQTQSKYGW